MDPYCAACSCCKPAVCRWETCKHSPSHGLRPGETSSCMHECPTYQSLNIAKVQLILRPLPAPLAGRNGTSRNRADPAAVSGRADVLAVSDIMPSTPYTSDGQAHATGRPLFCPKSRHLPLHRQLDTLEHAQLHC